MIQKQLEQYNIKLTDNQKEILSSYLKDLKSLFQKENIDLDAFYDIENSIIERLVEKKDNITDDYITKILKDLWTPEEIVEPFQKERLSVVDELKQIFPISWDNKELLKHYWKLLLKIIWWIWIWLWILWVINFFILNFVSISIFNIDITGTIPLFLKIFILVFSLFTILVSTYLISFKKSKLRNLSTLFTWLLSIIIVIFWWYNLISKYSNLNTYSDNIQKEISTWTNYEIWDINLFWPLTWNLLYVDLTKELTKEYLYENKDFIHYISGNKIKINIQRNILWTKSDTDKFNQNISKLVVKINDNKVYIYRNWLYFRQKTTLLPFVPEIKIELPKNIIFKY